MEIWTRIKQNMGLGWQWQDRIELFHFLGDNLLAACCLVTQIKESETQCIFVFCDEHEFTRALGLYVQCCFSMCVVWRTAVASVLTGCSNCALFSALSERLTIAPLWSDVNEWKDHRNLSRSLFTFHLFWHLHKPCLPQTLSSCAYSVL